jgi:hypothetical protein
MRCSGFPGRAAAHDLVEELLLALVQVGAQLDEIIRPKVDDAVVHLLVVVLAALLGNLWPAGGTGSRSSIAACTPIACIPRPAATWTYTPAAARTLSPSGSSCVFSTDTTESSVALSWSLLPANFSLARFAASWCNPIHSSSFDKRSSSAIAPAPRSACIMFFCETQGQGTHGLRSASSGAGCQGDCARERRPAPSELCSLLRRAAAGERVRVLPRPVGLTPGPDQDRQIDR